MTPGAASPRPRPSNTAPSKPVELWGGIECTVNRVADRYFDQVTISGHSKRIVDDLGRLADLGIRTLRYPVLWERIAPGSVADADWSESDLALATMQELGMTPIVGLVHHGSGPRHTCLTDPQFSAKLSEFAGYVARRYPWVEMFTPINEPLTTARFATLYGHWYPHARDDRSFARAILNQCFAVREAMAAIRKITPGASLVQTEDLGRTYSAPALAYQATFDNNRRWLTFDLLSGRLDEWHPLWWYLLESGIQRQELESYLERPCVPDIIGINHYVTSDRYLDDRVELYPPQSRGGNGRDAYADVEAVRSLEEGVAGYEGALRDAWDRYGIPLAITEVHLGCTREEQLRWLNEAWKTANRLRLERVDIRAVTVWALLGCYGWSSLLTSRFEYYESGAFDLRSPQPRPTALAGMARALATTGEFNHPVLGQPGWWRRKSRLMHPSRENFRVSAAHAEPNHNGRPILITGCNGTLGRAFQRIAKDRCIVVHAVGRNEVDICKRRMVATILADLKPWAVINAAGFVRVDDAEYDADKCYHVNTEGASILAEECAHVDIPLAIFSSDLVFDGRKTDPYTESDPTSPLNIYGASKTRLEGHVKALPNCLVVRTSAFFGPWDQHNFLATTFREIAAGKLVYAATDTVVSPTYVPDLVNTTLDLMIDGERGIWHLANDGALTWYEFARLAAERADMDSRLIVGRPTDQLGLRARRPLNSALASERGKLIPGIDDAIDRWLAAVTASSAVPQTLEKSGSV